MKYPECGCIVGGDLNTDLDVQCPMSCTVNKFMAENNLLRCDVLFPCNVSYTYVNEQLKHYSKIDYLMCDGVHVTKFDILESNTNLSDHLPIVAQFNSNIDLIRNSKPAHDKHSVEHLRWDHADTVGYFNATRLQLQSILEEIYLIEANNAAGYRALNDSQTAIEAVYDKLVFALQSSASKFVPTHKVSFYKFWWSRELSCLKEKAIDSDKIWKANGRPRSGPIYSKRSADKRAYKAAIRKSQSDADEAYSNDLHDALISKHGNEFWKCWNSKFGKSSSSSCRQVDGLTDHQQIADEFKQYFAKLGSAADSTAANALLDEYNSLRPEYIGAAYIKDQLFDAELVENILSGMKRGKAAGLDGLTAEHLQHCHQLLPCILAKLFNLMMLHGYVPTGFGRSYTVPLQKGDKAFTKSLTTDDFRGISISPVLSKVFEHCILNKFSDFFITSDNQFGFKKSIGCSHAIYSARSVINHYVAGGSTVNLCALDISKAYDKMPHIGLYVKLMRRHIPLNLLCVVENWFSKCYTCVKWFAVLSSFFKLECGVRQGGVLSPQFFAIYIDDIVNTIIQQRIGCYMRHRCVCIMLYADDILLLAPSVDCLQRLFLLCELELNSLGMQINDRKTVCMRIGPRYQANCVNICTAAGKKLEWVHEMRYLGVFFVSTCKFKCVFDNAKRAFYRSFNAIFGHVGKSASADVILSLLKSKCLPVLLYGSDVCPFNVTDRKSFEFTVTRALMKTFRTSSSEIIEDCRLFFAFPTVEQLIKTRKVRFLQKYISVKNYICKLFAADAECELNELLL